MREIIVIPFVFDVRCREYRPARWNTRRIGRDTYCLEGYAGWM
jgi:hypothetical protein